MLRNEDCVRCPLSLLCLTEARGERHVVRYGKCIKCDKEGGFVFVRKRSNDDWMLERNKALPIAVRFAPGVDAIPCRTWEPTGLPRRVICDECAHRIRK